MDKSIELDLRKEIKEINKTLTEVQKSLVRLETKQSTIFNFGGLVITTAISALVGWFAGHVGR